MGSLLDANDDWVEALRRFLWPKIDGTLKKFGLGSVGTTGENQYVGTLLADEEVIEEELVELGFERNPIAYLKSTLDGRVSEGSWALRSHDDEYGLLTRDEMLHVTLYEPRNSGKGRAVYAHLETDWQDDPHGHLDEGAFRPAVDVTRGLLDENSFLVFQ